AQSAARDRVRLQAVDALAPEPDRPGGAHLAHDGLHGGRTAGAVAPEQAHDVALADAERHAVEDVALAVVGVQVLDLKHGPRSARPNTTLMSCSTMTSVLPLEMARMSSTVLSLSWRLIPAVGSSRRITLAPPAMVMPISSARCSA